MLFLVTWPAAGLRHEHLQICWVFFAPKMLLQPASPLPLEPWLACPEKLFGSFFCAVVGSLKSHRPIVGTLTHDGWNFEIPSASSPEELVFVSAGFS